jgi:integrase
MNKLKMPPKPYKGLKIYCNKCQEDNTDCNHYDMQQFRVRVHIAGTKNKVKTKVLDTRDYEEAVKKAIDFRKELMQNNFDTVKQTTEGNDYSLTDAILKYNQYLGGNHPLEQKKKDVSKGHQEECIRFCTFFAQIVKKRADINRLRVVDVNKYDVSDFFKWAKNHYNPKTFNKCMVALKTFFKYLISDEEVKMKNPFEFYVSQKSTIAEKLSLSRSEFELILDAVGVADPIQKLGGRGENKSMYRPYLKDGFKMMLLTGGRREEVIELRWNDMFITIDGTKFFMVHNRKVEKSKKADNIIRYIPINIDLLNFLDELGYSEKRNTNEYVFYPNRTEKTVTIMNNLSKAFTHYKKACGINKNVSMKSLRKTYISWVRTTLGRETGKVTSHSSYELLKDYYIDPTIVSAIEKVALETRVFGT